MLARAASAACAIRAKARLALRTRARSEDFLIVDKDDIATSKPAPDVFAIALERSGAKPDRAAAVGDTRWDAEAATKIGVVFWGVLTGAGTEEELHLGGASQIFRDLPALLDYLRRL